MAGDFWKEVLFYRTVDSTNELASSLSSQKKTESGTVIIADMQSKGRGRLGRKWISPPGVNIYMSVILKPEMEPRDATLLTILSAVACTVAIRAGSGVPVSIKWPNDLVVSGKKIGGILTEVKTGLNKINTAIIGIGLNVNLEPSEFPDEIKALATSLKAESGKHHARGKIIISILKEIEFWFYILKREGRVPLLEEWRRLSSTLGKEVVVTIGEDTVRGMAEDIDDEGLLILGLPSGLKKKISAGDISILR